MKPSWFGFRKDWPLNMMNKLLKTMALGRIRNNDFSGEEEDDDYDQDTTDEAPSMNNNLQKLAHMYRSEDDVKLRFQQHEPLSIVVTNDNIFGCLMCFGMLQELVCVQFHKEKAGAYYNVWKLGSISNNRGTPIIAQQVKHYCLLLHN
jgi:hypothetical protein